MSTKANMLRLYLGFPPSEKGLRMNQKGRTIAPGLILKETFGNAIQKNITYLKKIKHSKYQLVPHGNKKNRSTISYGRHTDSLLVPPYLL